MSLDKQLHIPGSLEGCAWGHAPMQRWNKQTEQKVKAREDLQIDWILNASPKPQIYSLVKSGTVTGLRWLNMTSDQSLAQYQVMLTQGYS